MLCPRCQAENRATRRYCAACGSSLASPCPSCAFPNEPGERFCGGCGQPLTAAAPGAAPPPRAQPRTPAHLAEKIRSARQTLEGERKQVTVLFADIRGSLELVEGRDPEDARAILDPALQVMMEAVHRYEGTVNNLLGDGLMAIFGAPLAHEDHAVRACYAALDMQARMRAFTEEARRSHGVEIAFGVGLNSGEVVVRSIDSDLHMDYSAIGQTTHLASRMEGLALPGTVRLTGDTVHLAEGYVHVNALGPVPVKGLQEPVDVYELLGATPVRRRLQVSAARGFTPFVGRGTELQALGQALEAAGKGHGQLAALVGDPGVGKSRLAWELTHSERTKGWLVVETSSLPYGRATPYLPIRELLRIYFQIEASDDDRKVRAKVVGKLLTLDEALRTALPALLSLLEVAVQDEGWLALDPPRRRQRTLEAVKRLILRESKEQPLCVLLEDLHWIDSETQAVLEGLVEGLPTARVFLLVTYRPEYKHGWGGKTYYTQLRIDPLPAESAERLLDSLLGSDPALEPVKRLVVVQTEGNPFFLEESVRSLAEAGVLEGERGAYRLARAPSAIQVPTTVQAVLAARIDRLPSDEKRLLQSASVIGKDFTLDLLEAISDVGPEEVQRGLSRLQSAEFLYETHLFPQIECTFKHALTHEIAYASVLGDRRRALHALIVEALETLGPGATGEQVEKLAHHAERAELWPKALAYLRQTGARALGKAALRESATSFERALGALGHMPRTREAIEQAIDIRFDLRNSLVHLGERERNLDQLRQAELLAEELGDRRRLGRASCYLANCFWQGAEYSSALVAGERALAVGRDIGNRVLQVDTLLQLGHAYHGLGDYPRAVERLAAALEMLALAAVPERLAASYAMFARTWLAWSRAELGQFHEALVDARECLQIAERTRYPLDMVAACFGLGVVHVLKGEPESAEMPLQRGLALCGTGEFPVLEFAIASALGRARTLTAGGADAVRLLEGAVARAEAMGIFFCHPLRLGWLAQAYLAAGRRDDAERAAEEALRLAREKGERGNEAHALFVRGEVAAAGPAPDLQVAEASFAEAAALADELGMRPLAAPCRFRLADLHARGSEKDAALAEIGAATALFHAIGMPLPSAATPAPP
jgi:class 3 adenylate cyclase/tetratricopeptide (TPR) repeat protein